MRLKSLVSFRLQSLSRSWLTLAMVLGLLVGCSAQSTSSKAPDFKLTDLSGKSFSLKDYKGKVVFIDFWATWCPPCVMSSPEVEKLGEDYQGKDFAIIRISLDDSEEPVREFLARHPDKVGRQAMTDHKVDSDYNVSGIPAFYIIDKEGNLGRSWGGYHPMMPQVWRKEIDTLLSR